jgi:hypothetical protein
MAGDVVVKVGSALSSARCWPSADSRHTYNGGSDSDYNDLIVQIDFTSTAGHGWLV